MTTTSLRLNITSWDEQPYQELPGDRTLKQAEVRLAGDSLEATWQALLYYGADGTSTYVGILHTSGSIEGRTGSFVMTGHGTFDGTTARMTSQIVAGSGTDDFKGIRGRAEHASTHADYPHFPLVLTYELG